MNHAELWTLCQTVMGSLAPHYQREMTQTIRETVGFQAYTPTYRAKGALPEPMTLSRWHDLNPYDNPARFADLFENLVAEGYFEKAGEGAYRLTPKGDNGIQAVFTKAQSYIRALGPDLHTDAALERLAASFRKIVEATLAAPEPRAKWHMLYARWTDTGLEDSPLAQVDQYVTDLLLYRDDAHVEAWQRLGVSGHAWEALTLVWRDEANTPEAIAERQAFRGFSVDEYRAALDELVTKGWLSVTDGAYQVTDAGRQVREAAEDETNRLFFVGWQGLSEAELATMTDDVQTLLTQSDRLTAQKIWETLDDCGFLFWRLINAERRVAIEATGLVGFSWYPLLIGMGTERLTPATLHARNPYGVPTDYDEPFQQAIEAGALDAHDDGTLSLSEQGRIMIENILRATADLFVKAEVLPAEQLAPLAEALHTLTSTILADETLPTEFMRQIHGADAGPSAHPLVQIDQYNDELNAFRDGCHLAAWAHTGLSGIEWESFTLLWEGRATTPEGLHYTLSPRKYGLEDYQAAVATLVERGWVEAEGGIYRLTEAGVNLRESVEAETDAAFYKHWTLFDSAALNQLFQQVHALHDATLVALDGPTAERCEGLYASLNNSIGYLPPLYQSQLGTVFQDVELNVAGAFLGLLTGLGSPQQPFTMQSAYERFPYVSGPHHWDAGIEHLVNKGYIKPEGDGYVVTPEGKATEDKVNTLFYGALDAISPQLNMNVARLVELLQKVVKACKQAPVAKYIHKVYHSERSQNGSALAQLDYLYDCLNAFRDDAHSEAWREARVAGPAREAFTLIWRGTVKTAAELAEQLPFRRIDAEAYAGYLEPIVARGWLALDAAGVYTVTDAGQAEREQVERLTERNFYGAWSVLTQAEVDELRGLLQEFDAALVALQPQSEEASS